MLTPTFANIQQRYNDLIGEDTTATADAKGKRHINAAIGDILNRYKFSWNITSANITLSGGSANISANYNPVWGIEDARIAGSSQNDDNVFFQVPVRDRDRYGSSDYVYWITYNTTNDVYVFNSPTQTGTVTTYYNFVPAELSGDSDTCIVPDVELVAYLAASKNWIGDERNVELKREYEQIAERLLTALYIRDLQNGPVYGEGALTELNLAGDTDEFRIYRPY